MTTKHSVDDVLESLTGFDEIAAEKHIGVDVYTDGERKPILMMRALVFILLRRDGKSDAEARQAVMEMPLRDVNAHFQDEAEPMPSDPVTESGKDDLPPVTEPTGSLGSVSPPE